MLSPGQIRLALAGLRTQTDKPVNLNFFCHAQPVPDPERERTWRKTLAPYYRELGLDPSDIPSRAGRASFDAELVETLAPFRPAIVSFHFGLPSVDLLARVRTWGSTILSSATTVAEARWLEERGVDAIIAQGLEAGGHRGMFLSNDLTTQSGTLALVRQIVAAVRVPVIAAGGIADAAGVAAAMALGASGVQVGTAYLLCPEATTSAVHRAALAGDAARHTAITNVFTGRPARGIVNRLIREVGPMSAEAPDFPLAAAAVAPLRAHAESRGSGDYSPMWAGQNTSGCGKIPAADITRALAAGL
jgi:nitronate monooxygenase